MSKDNKTVAITLRFWTNDLEVNHPVSKVSSKACWDGGVALIEANKEKGIVSRAEPIQCYEDILPAIKELLRKSKIVVVSGNKRPRILSHRRRSEK